MKKISIILLIFIILIFAFSSYLYATTETNDLATAINRTDNLIDDQEYNLIGNNNTTQQETTNPDPTPTAQSPVSTIAAPQDFFVPENILSIILITIGIVLILLSIAIFVRLKQI